MQQAITLFLHLGDRFYSSSLTQTILLRVFKMLLNISNLTRRRWLIAAAMSAALVLSSSLFPFHLQAQTTNSGNAVYFGGDILTMAGDQPEYVEAIAEAGLDEVWCIIADDAPETVAITQALAQEIAPKTNLSTASRDEISAAIDYLLGQPGTPLKGLRQASLLARLDEAPRQYWKTLQPITKLGCGVTGGKKLKALEQVFYLTPEPMPEVIKDRTLLESLTTAQLKAMAKKRDIEGLSKLKKADLVNLLAA